MPKHSQTAAIAGLRSVAAACREGMAKRAKKRRRSLRRTSYSSMLIDDRAP
jgi:hypothetical protein